MRKNIYAASREDALAFLHQSSTIDMVAVAQDGTPMLKTVNSVVIDDTWLAFHASPIGEKTLVVGSQVVLSVAETVAIVPSHFVDPVRACPATTYYRSVQIHGVLEKIEDEATKAYVLQQLMERHQPEGGHVPITATYPLYKAAVRGLLVVRVSLEKMTGKFKLGQNRKPHQMTQILSKFWERGLASDLRAIELLRAANPVHEPPPFLEAPEGIKLVCELRDEAHFHTATTMLDGAYWNEQRTYPQIDAALRESAVRIGAIDVQTGTLIGVARAISDWTSRAWVYDVMVEPEFRGRGVGKALMRLLMDHPAVRGVALVHLSTRDADPFYTSLGFQTVASFTFRKWPSILMLKDRRPAAMAAHR